VTARARLAGLLVLLAGVVAIGAGLKILVGNELSPVGVGSHAPEFAVMTLDEPPVRRTLSDYSGNVVLLNLWATWCAPCRVEMPSIERLHRAFAPRGLKVIAIIVDDPVMDPQILSFVKQFGLTFEVLHDPEGQVGNISRQYQTQGYPETVIIGRDGIIRKKLLGAHDWNSDENRALIERLLAEQAG